MLAFIILQQDGTELSVNLVPKLEEDPPAEFVIRAKISLFNKQIFDII